MTDLYAKWKREIGEEWDAFIASLPMTKCTAACDAEKAVLMTKARAYLERGLHLTGCNGFPHTREPCDCGFQALKDAVAGTSPAAAALLAQGELHKKLLQQAATIIGLELEPLPAHMQPNGKLTRAAQEVVDWLKSARAALSGEEHVHVWVDARNEVVKAGEMCVCGAIRAGNESSGESPSRDS